MSNKTSNNITSLINDDEYRQWIQDISKRFRQQQVKAAVHINTDRLEFYWALGRDICEMNIEKRWGEGVIDQLSADLKQTLPDGPSLSRRNLYYIKSFYKLYNGIFVHQAEAQIPCPENVPQTGAQKSQEPQILIQTASLHRIDLHDIQLPVNIFAIPWGHHKLIIDRYDKQPAIALFYASKTLENNWSRATLLNMMGDKGKYNGLYERTGTSVNNFPVTLPKEGSDLACELMHDPLNLSFVCLQESYTEKQLKDALIHHIEQLLLALGTGFAYMGREYLLSVEGKEQFSDLLFYNTKLHAYVVVEVKVTEFESSYLGQLSGYMTLVNHILRGDVDNPTIGLLICRDKNNVFAQYCLEGYSQPIAITAYEGVKILPDNFNDALPNISQLQKEIGEK